MTKGIELATGSDFNRLIQKDREETQRNNWSGTFVEYLEHVQKEPGVVKLAHKRMSEVIQKAGSREILEGDDVRGS